MVFITVWISPSFGQYTVGQQIKSRPGNIMAEHTTLLCVTQNSHSWSNNHNMAITSLLHLVSIIMEWDTYVSACCALALQMQIILPPTPSPACSDCTSSIHHLYIPIILPNGCLHVLHHSVFYSKPAGDSTDSTILELDRTNVLFPQIPASTLLFSSRSTHRRTTSWLL